MTPDTKELIEALENLERYLRDTPHHNAIEAAAARKALSRARRADEQPTPPADLVEVVARAIYDGTHAGLSNCYSWDDAWEPYQEAGRPRYYKEAQAVLQALSPHLSGEPLPDLGPLHPLQMSREERAKGEDRLRAAYEVQQQGVPDQTALVWRADLMDRHHELIRLRARVGRTDLSEREKAREAFLNLIADATEWDEQIDEDGLYYTLRFDTAHDGGALAALMEALGLDIQARSIDVDGETYSGAETPADALDRHLGRRDHISGVGR